MLLIAINVLFVLTAAAMIVLILLQRGAGASAGSGFGGGASATVFGARGSANFLSKATKWCAIIFFSVSLGLAWYASKPRNAVGAASDLGIMGQVPDAAKVPVLPKGMNGLGIPVPTGAGAPAPAGPAPLPTGATANPGIPGIPAPTLPTAGTPTTAPATTLPTAPPAVPVLQPATPALPANNGASPGKGVKPGNKGG